MTEVLVALIKLPAPLAGESVQVQEAKETSLELRVLASARRVMFHLATSYPFQALFRAILRRVLDTPMPGRAGVG